MRPSPVRMSAVRMSLLAATAIAALALTGCASLADTDPETNQASGASVDIRGEWKFDGGTADGAAIKLSDFPVTMEFTNGSARVRTGCFSYDQPMTPDLDVLTASLRTDDVRASCMALSPDEDAAVASIKNVTGAERDGDSLTLSGDDLELEFTLVPAVPDDQVVGTWMLTGVLLGDAVLPPVGVGPSITFSQDGTVEGSTGCADFSGTYDIVSGRNTIGDLEYVEGVCTAEETQTMIDNNIREVLDNGFLVHAGEGSIYLVSSTTDSTLNYSQQA